MSEVYYYVTHGSSALGTKLLRLIDRWGEVMQAAADLCDKVGHNVEFISDERYAAGGIRCFVLRPPLRAKKLLSVVQTSKDELLCVPNPNTNRGLALAAKVARLPHVTDDEMCEPFGIDPHDPANKGMKAPRFFAVDRQWLYIASDTALDMPELTECTEEKFTEARNYVEENENGN